MFNAVNGLLPLHLCNLFITNSDIHYHYTRQHYRYTRQHYHYTRQHFNLHVIRHNNNSIPASSIQFLLVKICNLLDDVLKTALLLKGE